MEDIVSPAEDNSIFLSPVGCAGILRRRKERNLTINLELEAVLKKGVQGMSAEEIETKSRKQKRGRLSTVCIDEL